MKTKSTLLIAFLIIAVIFACRKDFSIESEVSPPSYLTEAKNFYYTQAKQLGITAVSRQKTDLKISTATEGKIVRSITPLWHKSYVGKSGSNDFTEVPIVSNVKNISLYNFAKKPVSDRINLLRASSSFKRLLIYRTAKGNFHQLQLTYIPDYDYLEKNNFDASSNQITKIKNDFSGYIEYSSVKDERRIFVLRFEKGKMISKISFGEKSKIKNTKIGTKSTKLSGGGNQVREWIEICTPIYSQICVIGGDPPVEYCGELIYVRDDCVDVWADDPIEDPVDPCYDENGFYLCDPEYPDPPEPVVDCAGVLGGSAYRAACGCIGGTTGISACPIAPVDTIMNVQDSCLRALIADVLNTSVKSDFRTLMNQWVIGNSELRITFQDGSFGPGSQLAGSMTPLRTGTFNGIEYLMGTLSLNSDYLNGASNEYKTVVIYHEILHAYLLHLGGLYNPGSVQHDAMASTFRNMLISALEANGVPRGDASDLAWFGLQGTGMWELCPNKNAVLATLQNYMKGGNKGTKCP